MKDRQAKIPLSGGGLPIISPVLHCLAMPALVFWRWDFGYIYLSPKSVFLACVFAGGLFSYAVWHDPNLSRDKGLSAFVIAASTLYLLHFVRSIRKEVKSDAEHDQFSGKSHLLLFFDEEGKKHMETMVQVLVEPLLTLGLAGFFSGTPLGLPLKVFGLSLATKELLRSWLEIRWRKRLKDNLDDSSETLGSVTPEAPIPVSAKGRKRAVERRRSSAAGDQESEAG